jgi:protein phosphatase 1 regulatory subunit 7
LIDGSASGGRLTIFNNLSLEKLQSLLQDMPDRDFRIQFSEPSAYDDARLRLVDDISRKARHSVSVRFYGHYSSTIDCAVISRLRACRSLSLDCLRPLANMEAIAAMPPLETFGINVFEANYDRLLRYPSVQAASTLYIGNSRKNDWDLQALAGFANLHKLSIGGQYRNIEVLSEMSGIRSLSLHSTPRKARLAFVSAMAGLTRLSLMLGGRDRIDEISHPDVDDLEIIRVKGLGGVDCAAFPALRQLKIEDQARITSLDLRENTHLQKVHISNCKVLEQVDFEGLEKLASLFVDRTSVDPEAFLASPLPQSLTALNLCGYGLRRDAEINAIIRPRGYRSVYRDILH